ncbi:MAG: rhodanese-like domain-containing protein [Cyanobacteria bacterium J06641_5]
MVFSVGAAALVALALYRALTVSPLALDDRVNLARQSEVARVPLPQWQVDSLQAAQLIASGATVLDARGKIMPFPRLGRDLFPGAIAVDWRAFSAPAPTQGALSARGRLHPDDRVLTEKLQALGISRDVPVVVVGSGQRGWGEEGRIVWMLRTLGHERAVFPDAGYQALARVVADLKVTAMAQPTIPGDFVVRRSPEWTITKEELRAQLGEVVILDARSPQEFNGATPFGETRAGHIPSARSFHWRETIGANGQILPREQLQARLQALDIQPNDTVVIYCTGGVRSAWLTAVLVDLGYDARNYAGSMWEWSASAPEDYPLEPTGNPN